VFTWFDKVPTVPKLEVKPGAWRLLSFEGNDRGTLEDGRSLITRQLYAEDFDDTNYPSDIRTRLVRFRPDGTKDYTDETNHPLGLDWQTSHTVEMATQADSPLGVEILVTGPGSIYLTSWGFRGVSLAELIRVEVEARLRAAFDAALATL